MKSILKKSQSESEKKIVTIKFYKQFQILRQVAASGVFRLMAQERE